MSDRRGDRAAGVCAAPASVIEIARAMFVSIGIGWLVNWAIGFQALYLSRGLLPGSARAE